MGSDVLIIGGGVIGLSIARELGKSGVGKITIVERGRCGRESSWAAAGMLGPQAEADEGGEFFDLCGRSRDLYPELAEELLDETGIDIELDRSGTLYVAFTGEDVSELQKRYDWQTAAGLDVERLSASETLTVEPHVSPDIIEGLFFPNDWQVENRKLCAALKSSAEISGVEIREKVSVRNLLIENNRVIGAETDSGTFAADTTIFATGAWTSLIKLGAAEMPFKVKPIRGQMIAFQNSERIFKRVIYSSLGYIVPRADGRVLAGSTTEDVGFDRSVTDSAVDYLKKMAEKIAAILRSVEVSDQWSGLRPAADDNLPIIGQISGLDGLVVATAHYRNGILLAPVTARLIADLINGTSQYSGAFSPDRFRLRGIATSI